MKILMLLSRCDQTGMTTHTLDLAEALVRRGEDVTVLVGYQQGHDEQSDAMMKRFLASGAHIKTFALACRESLWQKALSAISLAYKILIGKRQDIIHVQSPYLSWAPWLLRKRFVSTLHVNDLVKCFYYKNATELIAISRETRDYAMRVFDYDSQHITIVNHGVSPRFARQLSVREIRHHRLELGLPADKVILIIVGSIEPRKGHDILLRSVAALSPATKEKIHIVILGSDKNSDEHNNRWLDDVIESTGTRAYVSHFEYQSPELFYQISDVALLPSWLEGFGLVVVEAMLAGNLCIRTDTEGAGEQIEDGHTGYIFPKGDVNRLTAILEKVLNDDKLRRRVAAAGRDYALCNFTSDVMAENTLKVYKKLTDK